MQLIDLESEAVLADLPKAAAQAQADIAPAKEALAAAELALVTATNEVNRLHARRQTFAARVADLTSKMRTARLLFMQGEMRGDGNGKTAGIALHRRYAIELADETMSLSYATSWAIPAAEEERLRAEIKERDAQASLYEATAIAHRLKAASIVSQAADYDPGIELAVGKGWSSVTLEQADHIRRTDIPNLKDQLKRLIEITEREQSLAGPGLFNAA